MSEADCATYVRTEPKFHPLPLVPTSREVIRRNIESLRRIAEMAERRGISLIIVLTAHNHGFLDAIDVSDYDYFLREAATLGPIHNMMFYSSITTDDCNYYEVNHFRPEVGARIAKAISQGLPNDFVRVVGSANAEAEVEFIHRNFDSHRRRH